MEIKVLYPSIFNKCDLRNRKKYKIKITILRKIQLKNNKKY